MISALLPWSSQLHRVPIVALGFIFLVSASLVACGDEDPTSPVSDPEAEGLVELFLNARSVDGQPLLPDGEGVVTVSVDQAFDLELSYADLRGEATRLGASQIFVDLMTSQPNVLKPVLSETIRLTVGAELIFAAADEPSGTLEFSIEGNAASYTSEGATFAQYPEQELMNALERFGYAVAQDYSVRRLESDPRTDLPDLPSPPNASGTKASNIVLELRWDIDQHGNRDMPDIQVMPDFTTSIPTTLSEWAPFGPDGVTPNVAALRFNVDARSRSFNSGEAFYAAGIRGDYDPATGFTDLGGAGPDAMGGIPSLTDDGSFAQPFDAFRLRVKLVTSVTELTITAMPGQDAESVLLYGLDDPVLPEDFWLSGEHVVTVSAVF